MTIMNRRKFILLSMAAPAAALVPFPSGPTPGMFHGIEIARAGVYEVQVAIDAAVPGDYRVTLDGQAQIAHVQTAHDISCVYLTAICSGVPGQIIQLDGPRLRGLQG